MKNDLEIDESMGAAGWGLAAGASSLVVKPGEPWTVVLASEMSPAGASPEMSFFHASLHS